MTEVDQSKAQLPGRRCLAQHFNESKADQRSFWLSTTSLTSNAWAQRLSDGDESWRYKEGMAPFRLLPKTQNPIPKPSIHVVLERILRGGW